MALYPPSKALTRSRTGGRSQAKRRFRSWFFGVWPRPLRPALIVSPGHPSLCSGFGKKAVPSETSDCPIKMKAAVLAKDNGDTTIRIADQLSDEELVAGYRDEGGSASGNRYLEELFGRHRSAWHCGVGA